MADTRSAAGEGSEPGVPNRDQPAQELANLIAESDAKGKGFWRRRRRKSATSTGTPAPAPAAVDPAAANPTAADPTAGTTPAAEPDPESTEPAPEVNSEAISDTTAQSPDGKTAEGQPDGQTREGDAEAAPEAKAKVKKSSKKSSKESAAESAADDAAAGETDSGEQLAGEDAAAEQPAAEDPSGDQPASVDAAAGDRVGEDGAADAAVEEAAAEPEKAESEKAESAEVESAEVEPARSTVGVVYEPDESPDGFPLEYGNIIVGLPKSGAGESAPDAKPDPADGTPDSPEADNTAEDADTASEAVAAPEEAAEVAAEASDETNPGESAEHPDAASGQPDAEPESADAQTADDQPAAAEAEGADAASGDGESAAESPEGADQAAEQADGTSGQSDSPTEQPDSASGPGDAESSDQPADAENESSAEQTDGADQFGAAAVWSERMSDQPGPAEQAASDGAESSDESVDAEGESSAEQTDGADQSGGGGEQSEGTSDEPQSAEQVAADGAESGDESVDAEAESSVGQADGADQSGGGGEQSDGTSDEPQSAEQVASDGAESGVASDESGADAGEAGAEGEQAEQAEGASEQAEQAEGASEQAEPVAEGGDAAAGEGEAAEELTAEQMAERMAAEQAAMALITALMRLRGAVAVSQLPIDVVGADEARQQQKAMLDQLDDYILPRLVQLEAPVLAVVGGSTGAGKSTLVNSIIGKVVSEPGVLRPTTRSPVLIHHPADADWFAGDRVLPGMARSSGESPGGMEDPGQLRLVAADTVPQGLAILDAPDIDSVVEANRDLATQLLAAADLWLFVTTAARYADAVPWDFLQSASDRSTAVAVVLDRAPEDTIDDITGHLAQMLLERGLGESPLFSIKETVVDGNGMLPHETVASIKDWLIDLAADAEARAAVVRRTLHGAVTAMVKKTPAFAEAVRAQAETMIELRSTAETAYDRAVKDVAKATQDGTLLRGEVLARWQEFVGTGELLKGLQTNVGRLRDKMKATVVGKPPPTRDLNDAVESGLESLLREHAEAAAERAEESWQSTAPGRQLLAAGDRDMGRMSKDFPAAAGRAVRDWQGYVLDLVRKEGADKRSTARILAYGVNGLGLSLMVVIFASTAGITGAEVGVGAGTAVVGQKLLEAVFGDQAVRTLVTKAREDLDGRVHALMDAEFARYLAVLDQHPVDPEAARQLTEAARAVEDCT